MIKNNELIQLPYEIKRSIARFAAKLLRDDPKIHTILLDIKEGIEKAEQITDFELQVFYHAGSEEENRRIIAESFYNGGAGETSENYRIFSPRRNYKQVQRRVQPHEVEALTFYFPHIHNKKGAEYLKYLEDHGTCFIKNDFLDVTTINSTEMEKSDPLFYNLYISYCFKKRYVIYNRLLKPIITMHIDGAEE